jgi:hypothetical protein
MKFCVKRKKFLIEFFFLDRGIRYISCKKS